MSTSSNTPAPTPAPQSRLDFVLLLLLAMAAATASYFTVGLIRLGNILMTPLADSAVTHSTQILTKAFTFDGPYVMSVFLLTFTAVTMATTVRSILQR